MSTIMSAAIRIRAGVIAPRTTGVMRSAMETATVIDADAMRMIAIMMSESVSVSAIGRSGWRLRM
jgi:hypothetical protein